ncbi:hypothetical protein AAF712_010210 [Marasmius tenuissimus]|uniref:Chromo domain-containing protein n=1 Tax=Marasmius tenuissimus TaxID=585030 RepID=A0ABR2ZPQ3_9AGAR
MRQIHGNGDWSPEHIATIPNTPLETQFTTYNTSVPPLTPLPASVAPATIEPNPIHVEPPSGYNYPKGNVFHRREDNRYRARCVYTMSYDPPLDGLAEVDFLRRVILPPDSYPKDEDYDSTICSYRTKPIQGLTALIPGVPICVELNGKEDESVTVAALFDLESLKRYPEYDAVHECAMKLWDITWGKDGLKPAYTLPFYRNMRSGAGKVERPHDGSSSQASTRLEGNGRGFGVPASQIDILGASETRLSFLTVLSDIYRLLAPLALSKEEYLVTTFRAVDLNVYSFGGLHPTGLTSVQKNTSSGDEGGDLMKFIGAIQGAFHVDFHDDCCRWTMLVVMIKLPPGSDPGAFILARFGLYAKFKLMPDGRCIFFLFFKGNDLHSGVAPTVHPSVREAALAELAEHINKAKPVNRVVYVCYPSQDLCRREVPMMTYPKEFNSSGPTTNFHWYVSQGSPALGTKRDCDIRLRWDTAMDSWNKAILRGEKPSLPPTTVSLEEMNPHGEKVYVEHFYPNPTFPFLEHGVLSRNPLDHPEFFGLWRGRWKYHEVILDRYYLSMTKYQYRFGQEQARVEYERNKADGAYVMTNLASSTVAGEMSTSGARNAIRVVLPSSYAAVRRGARPKRQISKDATPQLPSKQPRTQEHLSTSSSPEVQLMDTDSEASDEDMDVDEDEDEDTVVDMEDELTVPYYELGLIVDCKVEDNVRYYKVRWSGFTCESDTWQRDSQLSRGHDLIQDYWSRKHYVPPTEKDKRLAYIALQRLFDRTEELTKEVETLSAFNPSAGLSSVQDLSAIVRSGHLLRQVSIQLENSEDFAEGINTHVLPVLPTVVGTIGPATNLLSIHQIGQFALNQAVGRAYLFIYSWFTDYGPYFTKVLLSSAAADTLHTSFPAFAPLVSQLLTSARHLEKALQEGGRQQNFKKLKDEGSPLVIVTFSVEVLNPFLSNCTSPLTLQFPSLNVDSQVPLIEWLEEPLLDFLSEHLMLARAQPIISAQSTGVPTSTEIRKAEWVIRGALAEALVDTFDSDSILGLDDVHSALKHPNSCFEQPGRREHARTLFNRIRKTPDVASKDVRNWLRQQPSLPQIQDKSQKLASVVHALVERLTNLSIKGTRRSASRKKKAKEVDFVGTTVAPETPFAQLIPYEERPNFAFLSFMLREVLAFVRNKNSHLTYLRRILVCQHLATGTGKKSLNPDHYSPIRFSCHFQRLIAQSLSDASHHLTSEYGLSNILLRFATGQGYRTRTFLERSLSRWFTSAHDAMSVFEAARSDDTPYSDGRCWGQFSRQLELREPFEDRLTPLFSFEVCDAWRAYWGNWQDTDHRTIPTASLPQYKDVFALLDRLKIIGFGAGSVTRMQLANYFAIEGLCQPPSAEAMAEITAANNKGALQGLLILGFNVRNSSKCYSFTFYEKFVTPVSSEFEAINIAFRCVYDFLDAYLSDADKETLGFDAIFVEHLLCKVTRWHNMLTRANLLKEIDGLLLEAKRDKEHWRDRGFPLPLVADRKELSGLVDITRQRIRTVPYKSS